METPILRSDTRSCPLSGAVDGDAMQIFILEDDPESERYLRRGLAELGHNVVSESNGRRALQRLLSDRFDVLVLDRLVPDLDGLTVLTLARQAGCTTPALMLTAMASIEDRVNGLHLGADDYLVKPFAFAELEARILALARRPAVGAQSEPTILRAAGIEMNLVRREVTRHGRPIDLQPREFGLLEYLLRNSGRIVTRTMLLDRVWNFGFDPKTNIVETHMSRLRAKLNGDGEANAIRTIRGFGYILQEDV